MDREPKKAELPKYKKPAQVPEPFQIPKAKPQSSFTAHVIRESASSYTVLPKAEKAPRPLPQMFQKQNTEPASKSVPETEKGEVSETESRTDGAF